MSFSNLETVLDLVGPAIPIVLNCLASVSSFVFSRRLSLRTCIIIMVALYNWDTTLYFLRPLCSSSLARGTDFCSHITGKSGSDDQVDKRNTALQFMFDNVFAIPSTTNMTLAYLSFDDCHTMFEHAHVQRHRDIAIHFAELRNQSVAIANELRSGVETVLISRRRCVLCSFCRSARTS